jgi:hypothetical protein
MDEEHFKSSFSFKMPATTTPDDRNKLGVTRHHPIHKVLYCVLPLTQQHFTFSSTSSLQSSFIRQLPHVALFQATLGGNFIQWRKNHCWQ